MTNNTQEGGYLVPESVVQSLLGPPQTVFENLRINLKTGSRTAVGLVDFKDGSEVVFDEPTRFLYNALFHSQTPVHRPAD